MNRVDDDVGAGDQVLAKFLKEKPINFKKQNHLECKMLHCLI